MKTIQRTTEVISISLPKNVAEKLDKVREQKGQSRSGIIRTLIEQLAENDRWENIYNKGKQTAKRFKITSEEDIDYLLHEP